MCYVFFELYQIFIYFYLELPFLSQNEEILERDCLHPEYKWKKTTLAGIISLQSLKGIKSLKPAPGLCKGFCSGISIMWWLSNAQS